MVLNDRDHVQKKRTKHTKKNKSIGKDVRRKHRKKRHSTSNASSRETSSDEEQERKTHRHKTKRCETSRDVESGSSPSKPEKECSYNEALVRKHVRDLVAQGDPNSTHEIVALHTQLDQGASVSIDGVANQWARKKLRHLLRDGWGFVPLQTTSSNSGPATSTNLRTHYHKPSTNQWRKVNLTKIVLEIALAAMEEKVKGSTKAVDANARGEEQVTEREELKRAELAPQRADVNGVGASGDRELNEVDSDVTFGPMPKVRSGGSSESESEDEEVVGPITTPVIDGGGREEWMMEPPAALKITFRQEGPTAEEAAQLRREEKRKRKEAEENEKKGKAYAEMMVHYNKSMGREQSLLDKAKEESCDDANAERARYIQKLSAVAEPWGVPAAHQRAEADGPRQVIGGGNRSSKPSNLGTPLKAADQEPWRRFDREKDLEAATRRGVKPNEFNRLIDKCQDFGKTTFGRPHYM